MLKPFQHYERKFYNVFDLLQTSCQSGQFNEPVIACCNFLGNDPLPHHFEIMITNFDFTLQKYGSKHF